MQEGDVNGIIQPDELEGQDTCLPRNIQLEIVSEVFEKCIS